MSSAHYAFKLLFVLMPVLICTLTKAQQPNFIHFQSENNQPYYVQWKGSTHNSSSTGYLVIPQVPVGDHTLIIGIPGNNFPVYAFSCSVADKPRGFSLKQGIENNLSLFDMVSFMVTRGTVASEDQVLEALGKPAEPVIINKSIEVPVGSNVAPAISRVRKIFEKTSAVGTDQVYIVFNGMKADTVALFIPALKEEMPKQSAATGNPLPNGRSKGTNTKREMAFITQSVRQNLFSK